MPAPSTLLTLDRFRLAVSRNETARRRSVDEVGDADSADDTAADTDAQGA